MHSSVFRIFGLYGLVVLSACAPTDLGEPCHLLRADNSEVPTRSGHTIVQSGNGECEEFICASFEGAPPVCTMPCTVSGDACAKDWRCTRAVLGDDLLSEVRDRTQGQDENADGVDDYEDIAGGLTEGGFLCAPP